MRILEEISQRSGGVKLREDNVLFMLSNKLKDLCNKYGIFIMSATQLSGDYAQAETPDQNLLRGESKSKFALLYLISLTGEGLSKKQANGEA